MTQGVLPLVVGLPRVQDMPPLWDGRRVEWGPWEAEPVTSARFHEKRQPCHACEAFTERAMTVGTVHPRAGETVASTRDKRSPSGRVYRVNVNIPARPGLALFAWRCARCSADVVLDSRTGEWWDLDPSDYGADGSTAP